jgi:hypothetical protein
MSQFAGYFLDWHSRAQPRLAGRLMAKPIPKVSIDEPLLWKTPLIGAHAQIHYRRDLLSFR